MSSVSRSFSQVRVRENYLFVAQNSCYGYNPQSIDLGIADALAEGFNIKKIGNNITSTSQEDLEEAYMIINSEEGYFEELDIGTVLKDLGKTVSFVSGDGLVFSTWRLVQRMRNTTGEGVSADPNDIFYVVTFIADNWFESVGVARVG